MLRGNLNLMKANGGPSKDPVTESLDAFAKQNPEVRYVIAPEILILLQRLVGISLYTRIKHEIGVRIPYIQKKYGYKQLVYFERITAPGAMYEEEHRYFGNGEVFVEMIPRQTKLSEDLSMLFRTKNVSSEDDPTPFKFFECDADSEIFIRADGRITKTMTLHLYPFRLRQSVDHVSLIPKVRDVIVIIGRVDPFKLRDLPVTRVVLLNTKQRGTLRFAQRNLSADSLMRVLRARVKTPFSAKKKIAIRPTPPETEEHDDEPTEFPAIPTTMTRKSSNDVTAMLDAVARDESNEAERGFGPLTGEEEFEALLRSLAEDKDLDLDEDWEEGGT